MLRNSKTRGLLHRLEKIPAAPTLTSDWVALQGQHQCFLGVHAKTGRTRSRSEMFCPGYLSWYPGVAESYAMQSSSEVFVFLEGAWGGNVHIGNSNMHVTVGCSGTVIVWGAGGWKVANKKKRDRCGVSEAHNTEYEM